MKKNQNLLGIAFVLVALQLFLLFLPTTRYTDDRAYYACSESYSFTQMIINYNDTMNDPGASSGSVAFFSFIFGSVTVYLALTALVNFVQALTFDHTSHKKLSLLCWASCFLALVPLVSWLFLKIIYEEDIFITLLGFAQIALTIPFLFLFNHLVPDIDFSNKSEIIFKSAKTEPVSANKSCPFCGQVVISSANRCDMCGKEIQTTAERIPTWKRIQQQENSNQQN